jgi:hypothetical protein
MDATRLVLEMAVRRCLCHAHSIGARAMSGVSGVPIGASAGAPVGTGGVRPREALLSLEEVEEVNTTDEERREARAHRCRAYRSATLEHLGTCSLRLRSCMCVCVCV